MNWRLPSEARQDLDRVKTCLRTSNVDPEKLIVCEKSGHRSSEFVVTLKASFNFLQGDPSG